jgi:uncharacterized protein (UPF0212 family)
MQNLSFQTIVQLWETGQRQHPLERMLTLLASTLPGVPRSDLLNLSVGQRDAYLLMLREHTFGSQFVGFAECPQCQERLECQFTVADIWSGSVPIESLGEVRQLQIEGYTVQVCLPTQADLLAIVGSRSVDVAHAQLLQRCIREVLHNGEAIAVTAVPDAVVAAIGEQMLQLDPQAEVQLALQCPACEHSWSVFFDITTFVWAEISSQAKRLLREVHILATAYSWHEADILAMSAIRRQFYLELVAT